MHHTKNTERYIKAPRQQEPCIFKTRKDVCPRRVRMERVVVKGQVVEGLLSF